MTLPVYVVDAFASQPFTGNPAAICFLDGERDAAWMQAVAAEMNLSETAYLLPIAHDVWSLRWFTPTVEVDLCGHATLAAAHTLWESERLALDAPARFDTRGGPLTCTRRSDGVIAMDFPARHVEATNAPPALLDALGVARVEFVGRNVLDYFVEVESKAALLAIAPDHATLRTTGLRGVIVTAAGEGDVDFVSRYFAPGSGIDEDPVTGSAHCALAPYWAERIGRPDLLGYQASVRGGYVQVRVNGDRVELAGTAVTTLKAELLV
jgi:PhzF family phenazine biosynthesis protein